MKTAGDPPDVLNACVVCEQATVGYSCKVCNMFFYCSKACSKMDTKKHKQVCSKLVLRLRKPSLGDGMSTQEMMLYAKHLKYMSARVSKSTEERAESKASIQSVLGGMKAAQAETDAARQLQAQATEARAAAKAAVATAGRSLNPKRYGDADYWEERHAKSRASGETFEWYTGYPDEALQKAFPQSVRGKKTLVIGCGTSVLSEKMCDDGFRDVLSIDTSKNAVEQMSARAKPFNNADTKCRMVVE